jgi:hypothetical protein
MLKSIDISGIWKFQLDEEKKGMPAAFNDTITLPGTTSYAKKGKKNENREVGFLTDEYKFEGYAWFSKEIEITEELCGKTCFLYLERTRVTTVWIDNIKIGTENSLSTPHIYELADGLSAGKHTIIILVDNTDYPTKGGHLTSPDTQTNWNGITGRIELHFFGEAYLSDIQLYSNITTRTVTAKAQVNGADNGEITISAESFNSWVKHKPAEKAFSFSTKEVSIDYELGENTLLWSEYEPNLYTFKLSLKVNGSIVDTAEVTTGLRELSSSGDKFTINGVKTFMRGKHDGLIFPKTGFAPTTVEEWLEVLKISKSYGINHYRFHTCCPPEAAFEAADILGIYMQPELPFWGTMTDESYENHNAVEQEYLINEGFAMLDKYGNHPSFAMMSLGNELWGSKERMAEILHRYKSVDNRHLYTQGSNNFQFTPVILQEDDFFSGVRFSRDRLIRGSYAMCDAPLGHVQVGEPNTMKSYDENIYPSILNYDADSVKEAGETIEIQFGTGTKKVEAISSDAGLIPNVPVVSHEIGQYETYPNFDEISKYTGPLKARNFEVFKERLEEKGLGDLAKKYFKCSGKLAMAAYKEELEAVFRSRKMGGFQILDIQDFSGQGTALVGVLDAFMDSKGLISLEEWRSFCSDVVLLARFEKYNFTAGENFKAHAELSYYRPVQLKNSKLVWELGSEKGEALVNTAATENYIDICDINVVLPDLKTPEKLTLSLKIEGTDIFKSYDLWVYPRNISVDKTGINIFEELNAEAVSLLEKGEKILLMPRPENLENSIEGTYCVDFWCYPMFCTISRMFNKPLPVGTLGLLIDNTHPIFNDFPCEEYSTYQWWSAVSNSRAIILDDTPKTFRPIVQTIDNFDRNHKLGTIFETGVLNGKLLVCSIDFDKILNRPEGKQLLYSVLNYFNSDKFQPKDVLDIDTLRKVIQQI